MALPFQGRWPIFQKTYTLMNHPKGILWLLGVLLGLLSLPVVAQINLKTGYNFSWLPDPGTEQLINVYRSPEHTRPFPGFDWLHGFEAGIRYKAEMHALELGYQGGYRSLRADGTSMTDGTAFTDKLKFAVHSGTFGYVVSGDVFGMGAALQHQWYKTTYKPGNPAAEYQSTQSMWAYSFFMTFTLAGRNQIDMVIKPYYTIPDKPFENKPVGPDIDFPNRKWNRIGISLIFYNGPKD
jgi:hypothetical protein